VTGLLACTARAGLSASPSKSDDFAIDVRLRAGLDRYRIKFESGQRLHASNHPNEGLVGQTGISVPASNAAVNARKPGLLDMSSRLLPFRDCPERGYERPTTFIDSDGVQTDINVASEPRVVEPEEQKRDVSRERRKAETSRHSV
jgi:hypothetical protein